MDHGFDFARDSRNREEEKDILGTCLTCMFVRDVLIFWTKKPRDRSNMQITFTPSCSPTKWSRGLEPDVVCFFFPLPFAGTSPTSDGRMPKLTLKILVDRRIQDNRIPDQRSLDGRP